MSAGEDWADEIRYTRRPLSQGGHWVCNLSMHEGVNGLTGEGFSRQEAYRNAITKAGKRRRFPTWPLSAAALGVAGVAGVNASYASDPVQVVAAIVASLTAIRLLILRL